MNVNTIGIVPTIRAPILPTFPCTGAYQIPLIQPHSSHFWLRFYPMEALRDQSAPPTIDIPPTRPSSPPQNEISSPNEPPASGRLDHSCSISAKTLAGPAARKQVPQPPSQCTIVPTGADSELPIAPTRSDYL